MTRSSPAANLYGQRARAAMEQHRPQVLAGIVDPDSYFSTLGLEIEDQVVQLADAILGPPRPGEPYQVLLGRRREAWLAAEDEVLRQYQLQAEEETDPQNPPGAPMQTGWLDGTPDPDDPIYQQELRQKEMPGG